MKIRTRYLFAAMMAAAPVAAAAQNPAPPAQPQHGQHGPHGAMHGRHGGPGGMHHSPIQGVLQHRQQLSLTAEQVSRLEAIDRDLQARNEPLHQQLRALMPGHHGDAPRPGGQRPDGPQAQGEGRRRGERAPLTSEQRQQMERVHEQARPIMEQVHQNMEGAIEQVRAVLNDEQERQLHDVMRRQHGPGGHGRGGHHGPGGDGPRGERPREGGRPPR